MMKTERLSIRRIGADDWKAIQTMWAEVAKTPYAQFDTPKDTSDDAVRLRIGRWSALADSTAHIFLAVCLEEQVIGYVSLNRREKGYELGYCFRPPFHGRGYAGESISKVLGELKKRGVSCVEAGTALRNQPSVNLLTRLGFKLVGTEKVSFYKDIEGKDILFDGGRYLLML